jgi:large subunit ribosomal protein L35
MGKKKLKTKKSIAKRVKITARGKILRHKAGKRHLLSSKNARRKRKLRHATLISPADTKMIKRMLPYG